VNGTPPLSSYNRFACLEVDTPIEPLTCITNSTEVVQTPSHPPIPDRRSCLPAWERQSPVKYVVAASPGLMSLAVNVEIKLTDTVVKRCTQALIDCGATGCFIDIEWAKLNNIPTHPLTKPIPVYNVDGSRQILYTSPLLAYIFTLNSSWLSETCSPRLLGFPLQ
jgi:hypothetical protein